MSTSVNIIALSSDTIYAELYEDALVSALRSIKELMIDSGIRLSAPKISKPAEAQGPAYQVYLVAARYRGDINTLRKQLEQLPVTETAGFTLNAATADLATHEKKLIIMDVDSTLIRQEVIDELATYAGRGKQVARITELAMNGELDFEQSLRKRVTQLKGVPESVLAEVAQEVTFTPGAHDLVKLLTEAGHVVGAVSGGFLQVLNPLAQQIGLSYARANQLEITNGYLTGRLVGQIITPEVKRDSLIEWAQREGISKKQIIAVGDGANDHLMCQEATLGIAFNAKQSLRESADAQINTLRLDTIRHFIGL